MRLYACFDSRDQMYSVMANDHSQPYLVFQLPTKTLTHQGNLLTAFDFRTSHPSKRSIVLAVLILSGVERAHQRHCRLHRLRVWHHFVARVGHGDRAAGCRTQQTRAQCGVVT